LKERYGIEDTHFSRMGDFMKKIAYELMCQAALPFALPSEAFVINFQKYDFFLKKQ
jgi:hypothetical protein